jgi:3-oxoacyl-[acyl-carrier-protein] synthase II
MGAVTPIGNDVETFWSNLLAGTPGGGPITTFDTTAHDVTIAAEVKGFDPLATMDRKMVRRLSRFVHFGVAAATEAVDRSGIDFASMTEEQRDRVAVVLNTGGGGMEMVIDGADTIRDKGPGQVSPFAIPALSGSAIPLLNEIPNIWQAGGGIVALIGIYIINRAHQRTLKEPPSS